MTSEAAALPVFGSIVLIPFPFTDQSAFKRRPAVVISSHAYNTRHADIIVMPVTSQLRGEARPDDVPVEAWEAAGLLKPSAVKPVIATIEASLIIRMLGRLDESGEQSVRAKLQSLIG